MNKRSARAAARLVPIIWCLTVPLGALWAQNENENVGFRPNHVFESGNFGEDVDILNGGLNMSVSIGQQFLINSRLGHGLKLSYSSKVWDTTYYKTDFISTDQRIVPSTKSPFGIGFSMTMGRIYEDFQFNQNCGSTPHNTCFSRTWTWISPDGVHHTFFFDSDDHVNPPQTREEDGVFFDPAGVFLSFTGRMTTDLSYAKVRGPGNEYCVGTKDDGTAETNCMRVESPDGLVYTLAKRVDCIQPSLDGTGQPTSAYQQIRTDNQNFCGWYTKYIEDPSLYSRVTNNGVTSPYPNNVKVVYDTRPNFQHAIASITDSATRTISFHNCEWWSGGHCSTTTQACNGDSQCPSPQICYTGVCSNNSTQNCSTDAQCPGGQCAPIQTTTIDDMCMTGSKDPATWTASDRSAVATYAVDVPSLANCTDRGCYGSTTFTPSAKATFGFMYEYTRIRRADLDLEGPTQVYTPTPILKLLRLDYPGYIGPGQSNPDLYSLYYGYYNDAPPPGLASGGNGDYGEVTCRTLPLLRKAGSDPVGITANACSQVSSWPPDKRGATFKYSYGYYVYVGKFMQASKHGVSVSITGLSRQMVTKELQLPSGASSGQTWQYKRNTTAFTNPTQVTVSDPLGNDTVYYYHASQSTDNPNVGPDPSDGYAPEWSDGSNFEIDYYRGNAATGRLLQSELQEHDSDLDPQTHAHSKSNVRVKRATKRFVDAGGAESIVSRDQWDGYGHWQTEVESGFNIDVPRRTTTTYQNGAQYVYITGLPRSKEVSDGQRVLSRTENEYDAYGRLTTSIARANLPASIGTPVPANLSTTSTPGDVLTQFTSSTASGNIISKTMSTGRFDDPIYYIKYTYAPSAGNCTTAGECGGYLASKAFTTSLYSLPLFKSIDRDRDANTGLILATRDTAGVQTNYTYDALGRVTQVLPAGEEPTQIAYESLTRTAVTQGTPGTSDLDPAANFVFTRYIYDGLGRQVVTQKRPADISPTDPRFACQKTQYDVAGHVVYKTEWTYQTLTACDALPVPGQNLCTASGINRTTDPGTEFDYSEPGTVPPGVGTCDPFGRVRLNIPADGDRATNTNVTRTDYYGTSQDVTENSIHDAGGTATYSAKTSFIRDAFERLVTVDSPAERRCTSNNVACTTNADCGGATCAVTGGADAYYDYDPLDRLVQVKLSNNLVQTQIRRMDYDGLGNPIWADNPESGTTVYEGYDALGNLLREQHPNGNGAKFRYDFAGRVSEQDFWFAGGDGSVVSGIVGYGYDNTGAGSPYGLGKLSSISRYKGAPNLYQFFQENRYYNGIGGRLSSTTHSFTDFLNFPIETTSYTYDTRGELTSIQYPVATPPNRSILKVNYGYSNGMVVMATEDGQGTALGRLSYNAAGAVASVNMPNGRTETTFDSRNRPKTIKGGAWNGTTWSRDPEYQSGDYNYDGVGNIFQIGSNWYGYDAVNRLITAHTEFQGSIFNETFFYDPFGNMDQRILDQQIPPLPDVVETEAFTYSNPRSNRIMTRQTTIGSSTPSAVNFVYDAAGNLLQGGRRWIPDPTQPAVDDVKKYQYDPINHLVRIQQIGNTSNGGGLAEVDSFEYDASGNRLWKIEKETGIKTYYLRDPSGQVLSEFRTPALDGSGPEWSSDYVYLAGRLLALKENLKPRPPLNLRATLAGQGPGTWRVTLTWDENSEPDKSYYKVYRKVDGTDATFIVVAPPNPPATATYADPTNFVGTKTVHYKVSAVDSSGYESNLSLELKVVTGDTSGPPAPTLTLAEFGDGYIKFTWTVPTDASDIVGYEVDRRLSTANNVPSLPITGQLVKSSTFTDYNLNNGQYYYYRVRAQDAAGNWGPMSCQPGSICDLAASPSDHTPPPPPKGLKVSSTCGTLGTSEKMNLSWEANPPSGSYTVMYEVYRDTAPIYDYRFPPLTSIAGVSTAYYQDPTALTPGTTYYYAVKAYFLNNGSQFISKSPFSKCVAGKIRDSSIIPKLQIFARPKDGSVDISWQIPDPANPPPPSQYLIYRKLNTIDSCVNYVQIQSVTSASGSFTDSGVPNNVAYDYAMTAIVGGVESSFSRPTLAIPLARPFGQYQCRVPDPWGVPADSNSVQWMPPASSFYQPLLASTADGTSSYLKGYHLYHYKLCGRMSGPPVDYQDDSPTREIVTDVARTIDPYLIYKSPTGSNSGYVYQDPRYAINSTQILSPQFNRSDTDNRGRFLYGDCAGTPNFEPNCVMPKAVYKVFAEGTWLTAESDWPDYFDTLNTDPSLRCKTFLHEPTPNFPRCGDNRPTLGDPNFVPPPSKVTAVPAGPGSIRLDWVKPAVSTGRPPIAGYYLYARRNNDTTTFKHPLPFATVGPNETTVTLSGLRPSSYEFSVSSFDTAGHVSGQDYTCRESGSQCEPYAGCTTGGVGICDNTSKPCATQADCSYGVCTVSLASCDSTGTCPAGVCSNNHAVACTPIRFIRAIRGANSGQNWITPVFPTPPAKGNALIAVIGTRGASDSRVSSVTQPGVSWNSTRAVQKTNPNGVTIEIWYALTVNENAGTQVTINLAAQLNANVVIAEYSGILSSSALDQFWSNSNTTKSNNPSTGQTSTTSQGNEIWVGGMANIDTSTYSGQTNGFTERLEAQIQTNPDSTLNNTVLEDLIQSTTGGASVGATLSAKQFWAGAIATFKTVPLESAQCGAGNTCIQQTCDKDVCVGESCEESIGRWCTVHTDFSCTQSSQCPGYYPGQCNISGTTCNAVTPCPTGEVCVPGELCRNVIDLATASPGAQTASPAPPTSLKTVLWTLNDAVLSLKRRNGVKLAWVGVSGATGYRVYRSATPEGPFCALLDSGVNPSPPLPSEAPTRCTSDIPAVWSVDYDAASVSLSTTATNYWDQTVMSDTVYYYRVTTVAGSSETPFSSAYQVRGRELPYDKTTLPPPQGFRAWASQTGGLVDKESVMLKWCAIPTPSGNSPDVLPTVDEYRVYRTKLANGEGVPGTYRLLARLSPACLTAGRCEIRPATDPNPNVCVDSSYNPKWDASGNPSCPIIAPTTPCDDTNGPRCGIADRSFTCWPRLTDPVGQQYPYNYRYFVTAVGTLQGGYPQAESMPSAENAAWLNYCYVATCPATPTSCSERRDPDGNGEYLVCGGEDALLMDPDGSGRVTMTDAMTCEGPSDDSGLDTAMAPRRVIGQSNPYNPPARWIFYHLDHLGSARLELDVNGVFVAQHHYLPFGEERPPQVDPSLNTHNFTGHERDRESGLDYMMARYYSSSLGRFMVVDPGDDTDLGDPQSWNKYAYVRDNPINRFDPNGEDGWEVERKLKSEDGPPVSSSKFLAHDFVAVTGPPTSEHPNGVVTDTASWNNGKTRIRDTHDMGVAQEAIDQGLARHATGPELDDQLRIEINSTTNPKHPSHHIWGLFKTCKGEARRLLKDAKKHSQQESSHDPEQSEKKQSRLFDGPFFGAGGQPSHSNGGYVDVDGTHKSGACSVEAF